MELQEVQAILATIKAEPMEGKAVFSAIEENGGFKIKASLVKVSNGAQAVFAVSKGYWIPKNMKWNDIVLQAWKIINDTMVQHLKETFFVENVAIWTYQKPTPRELVDKAKANPGEFLGIIK